MPKQMDFTDILASSIHDMKNSLGMVLNSLDEIMNLETGECRCTAERAAQLQYEAKRVNDNLIQLLTLYRVGNGLYSANPSEQPVAEFLEEVYLMNKPLFDFKGIEVAIDCEDDPYGFFDRELMIGVLSNVITNTVRYTKDRMRIAAFMHDDWLCMRVEDNGDGFPQRMLINGAEDYAKIDFGSGRTGLGLYFCSVVAQLHTAGEREGYIALNNDSSLGGGCFSICLP